MATDKELALQVMPVCVSLLTCRQGGVSLCILVSAWSMSVLGYT